MEGVDSTLDGGVTDADFLHLGDGGNNNDVEDGGDNNNVEDGGDDDDVEDGGDDDDVDDDGAAALGGPSQLVRAEPYAIDKPQLRQRLDAMSIEEVERTLATHYYPSDDTTSLLDLLRRPAGGDSPAEVARNVLDAVAGNLEESALLITAVWRYIENNELWLTHSNLRLRSPLGFLNSLDEVDIVKMHIVVGTSADQVKRRARRTIEACWGHDWYDRLPAGMRPAPNGADMLSKGLLLQISANCKQGLRFDDAVEGWKAAIATRTDPALRRASNTRLTASPVLQPMDVASLNVQVQRDMPERRVADAYFPEFRQDRFELRDVSATPGPSDGVDVRKPGRRRRADTAYAPSRRRDKKAKVIEDGHDGAGEGTTDVVEATLVEATAPDQGASVGDCGDAVTGVGAPGAVSRDGDCRGYALLKLLHQIMDCIGDGDGGAGAVRDCCDQCRIARQSLVQAVLDLRPLMTDAELQCHHVD